MPLPESPRPGTEGSSESAYIPRHNPDAAQQQQDNKGLLALSRTPTYDTHVNNSETPNISTTRRSSLTHHETEIEKSKSPIGSITSNDGDSHQKEIPYCPFTKTRRALITATVSMIGIIGPISTSIYYPSINNIVDDLDTTLTMANATLTVYMFSMAVFTLFWGPLADIIGRRPVYVGTMILYLGGNIGCALTPNITALIVFRIIQSAGASSVLSIGAGTIADIYPRSERGTALGAFYIGPLIGPVIGPLVGGYIAQYLDWRWNFWILTILSGISIVACIFILPETHRRLMAKKYDLDLVNQPAKLNLKKLNPIKTLKYLKYPNVIAIVFYVVMVFGCYYGIASSNAIAFETIYGLSQGTTGLCYLPLGVGNLIGSLLAGKLNDYILARLQARLDAKAKESDVPNEQKETVAPECRLYFVWVGAVLFIGCGIAYGWLLVVKVPLAPILVLQFFIGFSMTLQFSSTTNYLIDLFPTRGATIIGAQTFCRSIWAGICMLVIPMSQGNLGWGKTLTIFESTCILGFILFLPIVFYGRRIAVLFPIKE